MSPLLEASLRASLGGRYDVDKIYVKVFRWLSDGTLLVGVNAVIFKHIEPIPDQEPAEEVYQGYIIDPEKRQVVRELDKHAMPYEHCMDLEKQTW